ncbi:MAG: helix-turn-helix domain-containing protein [Catenulispora sp.]|nr:helix-turn-helix domain-containing protein [Catenulispora sp.]
MARWKSLPGGLDPTVVRLVVELRRVKDGSGLTLDQLATRTGYSASSWERYLGGRLLPPREAVEAFATATRTDPVTLVALCDAAADGWRRDSERPTPVSVADPSTAAADTTEANDDRARARLIRSGRRWYSWRQVSTVLVSAAVGALVATISIHPRNAPAPPGIHPVAVAKRTAYVCAYVQRDGLWYAGNDASNTNLVVDMSGPPVAELQCLLQRLGITPGGIDGNFGPLTEAAVIKAQKRLGLDVDGQVGPHTWVALRG